jgi:hypothetical protein
LELGESSQQIFHVRLGVVVKTMFLRFLSRQASKMVGLQEWIPKQFFHWRSSAFAARDLKEPAKAPAPKTSCAKEAALFKHVSELAITKKRARVQALEAFKQQKSVRTSSEPGY